MKVYLRIGRLTIQTCQWFWHGKKNKRVPIEWWVYVQKTFNAFPHDVVLFRCRCWALYVLWMCVSWNVDPEECD